MFIQNLGPEFFTSRIQIFSIANPGSASKNLSILTQKIYSKLSEIWSGLFIPDPDPLCKEIPQISTISTQIKTRVGVSNSFATDVWPDGVLVDTDVRPDGVVVPVSGGGTGRGHRRFLRPLLLLLPPVRRRRSVERGTPTRRRRRQRERTASTISANFKLTNSAGIKWNEKFAFQRLSRK